MNRHALPSLVAAALLASACGDSATSDPESGTDTISILSATPDRPLVDGDTVQFRVVVEYGLASTDSGEIDIGFNNWTTPLLDALVDSASRYVAAGTGRDTILVSTPVKSWGTEGAFRISAKLSEHPHPQAWKTLAEDMRILIPKQ